MRRNSSEAIRTTSNSFEPSASAANGALQGPIRKLGEFELMKSIVLRSFKKAHVIGMFVVAVGFLATPVVMPSDGNAQDARVREIDGGFESPDHEIRSAKD